jgi:hypothetical protein
MRIVERLILVACLLAALTAILPDVLQAKEPVTTNFEIMKALTTEISEELISGFPADAAGHEIRLSPSGTDERYEFIANVLTGTLTRNGYRAFAPMAAAPRDSLGAVWITETREGEFRLEFQAIDFDLRYPKVYRSYLIGGKKVKRRAEVRLLVRLVDPADGLVVWVGEASRAHDDQFSYGRIEEVEAGLYSFNKPPRSSRKWGKVIEPVAVSAIVVGLIYLFFSNQSSD